MYASSSEGGTRSPDSANDDNLDSLWISNFYEDDEESPIWIYADLGSNHYVKKVILHLGNNPKPQVDLIGPQEARIHIQNLLKSHCCQLERIVFKINQTKSIQISWVLPITLGKLEKFLVSR